MASTLKHGASVVDFRAAIAQVRKWSLDLEDKAFAEEIELIIANELMPLYEVVYGNTLLEEQDTEQFKTGFREFVALFKNSSYINRLVEKNNDIWALEQYKTIYQVAVNSSQTGGTDVDKLLQLCREYLNTHKKHSHTYGRSVQALIRFIENNLARVKKGGLYPRSFRIGYRGHTLTDGMYGHHKVDVKVPIQVPYTYIDSSGWTDKERSGYRTEYKTEQKEVRTTPQVVISVTINGVEQYSLDTIRRHTDRFSIDWMPGMTIKVVVNNKTGKTTQTENSGFLAINLLKGELNVNGLATVKFTGSDLTVPEMQAPSKKFSKKMYLRNQAVIYRQAETVHLGDEKISSSRWKSLHGECFTTTFDVNRQVQKLTLKVDIWGSESPLNAIFLNGTKVAVLPYKERRTRKWITETVVLAMNELRSNRNQLKICSGLIEGGDKDDLQIRKLKLIVE